MLCQRLALLKPCEFTSIGWGKNMILNNRMSSTDFSNRHEWQEYLFWEIMGCGFGGMNNGFTQILSDSSTPPCSQWPLCEQLKRWRPKAKSTVRNTETRIGTCEQRIFTDGIKILWALCVLCANNSNAKGQKPKAKPLIAPCPLCENIHSFAEGK